MAACTPPFLSARVVDGRWHLEYDFSRPHAKTAQLLQAGDEFLSAAETAFGAQIMRAFVENSFHAAESYARAELLAVPIAATEIEGARKHSAVQWAYDLWARLENTDKRFPALLWRLERLRRSATYAESDFTLGEDDAQRVLDELVELRTNAHDAAASPRGRVIRVIATRPLEASEWIAVEDATIRPTRRSPRASDD